MRTAVGFKFYVLVFPREDTDLNEVVFVGLVPVLHYVS